MVTGGHAVTRAARQSLIGANVSEELQRVFLLLCMTGTLLPARAQHTLCSSKGFGGST